MLCQFAVYFCASQLRARSNLDKCLFMSLSVKPGIEKATSRLQNQRLQEGDLNGGSWCLLLNLSSLGQAKSKISEEGLTRFIVHQVLVEQIELGFVILHPGIICNSEVKGDCC